MEAPNGGDPECARKAVAIESREPASLKLAALGTQREK